MKLPRSKNHQRGVALIITLILLALLSAASLAMVLMVSSDTMINGYYRNYRGSFYAADSGVNIVVQSMYNAVLASATPAATLSPLPTGAAAMPTQASVWVNAPGAYPAALTAAYTGFQGTYNTIGDTGSWKSQFKLLTTNPGAGGPPILGTPQFELMPNPSDSNSCLPVTAATCPNGKTNTQDYIWYFSYPYTITVQGQSAGSEVEQVTETGTITYTSSPGTGTGGNNPSFAKWAAFITNYSPCIGALVPGLMTGPFFTDGQWEFGNFTNPGYTFTDYVGQAGANVSWWPNGCVNSPTAPSGFKQPVFQAGLQLNQAPIVAPTNTYSQAQAVLDAKGTPPCTAAPCAVDPAPTQAQLSSELKTVAGTSYPSSGSAPSAVYIPYYTSGTSPTGKACSAASPCYGGSTASGGDGYGGGFYVQGNATVALSATTSGSGSSAQPTQTYTITQGSTVTTIVVNNSAGTTTVTSGSTVQVLQGVPQQLDPNTGNMINQTDPSGNVVNPTLVYVNGQVSLNGTIQNDVGVTIASSGNVILNGDTTYVSSPVSVPADVLNTTTDAGVLGVYTTGNINMAPNTSGSNKGNLTVDGSLAALSGTTSQGGFCTSVNISSCDTSGAAVGTFNNVGGQIQSNIYNANVNVENTYYDRRFANNFGPPWFPTAVPQPGTASIPPIPPAMTITRTSWQEIRP